MTKLRVVLLGALVVLAACSSEGATSSTPDASATNSSGGLPVITVAGVTKEAGTPGENLPACPLPLDPAAAAKSAGVNTASFAPQPPAEVQTNTSAGTDPFLVKIAPAVAVECDYSLGAATIHSRLIVCKYPHSALNGLFPDVVAWSDTAMSVLDSYVKPANAAPVGKPTLVPNGRAAAIWLNVSGGDGALVVGVDAAAKFTPAQVGAFTTALAAQIH